MCGDVRRKVNIGHEFDRRREYASCHKSHFGMTFICLDQLHLLTRYLFWNETLSFPFFAVGNDVLVDVGANKSS